MSDFRTLHSIMVPQGCVDLTRCFLSTALRAAAPTRWQFHWGTEQGFYFTSLHVIILPIFHCTMAGSSSSHTARGYQLIISLSFKATQKKGETKWVKNGCRPQLLLPVILIDFLQPPGMCYDPKCSFQGWTWSVCQETWIPILTLEFTIWKH